MTNTIDQFRPAFEDACYAYYLSLKAGGWSDPGEGDQTRESMFWRKENGMYGVQSVQAGWNGFMMAVRVYVPQLNAYVDLAQRAATPAGLLAGDDIPEKLVPAIQRLAVIALDDHPLVVEGLNSLLGDVLNMIVTCPEPDDIDNVLELGRLDQKKVAIEALLKKVVPE